MPDDVDKDLFEVVRVAVGRICRRGQVEPKLIITEGDLQSLVFTELVHDPEILDREIDVHNQINYLKENGALGNLPDLVLLPPNAYSVDTNGELHDRKGYTVWGSSIAVQLKLLRSHRHDGFLESVEDDFNKLKQIRQSHYNQDPDHSFFGAVAVLCRQRLSTDAVNRLGLYADEAGFELWLFNNEAEQGADGKTPQAPQSPD